MCRRPWIFGSLVLAFALAGPGAHAAGQVKAVAGANIDAQSGPAAVLASASAGSLAASTTRLLGEVSGSVAGGFFIDPYQPMFTLASSDFTLSGLVGLAPLTFNWRFAGSRAWDVNNASVGAGLSATLSTTNFIDTLSWGISYVDGPLAMGDFAGILAAPFGVSMAGSGFHNTLPAGDWDGQGSRLASSTMEWGSNGTGGSFALQVEVNLSGNASAAYSLQLLSVTVPNASYLSPGGAALLLDNGGLVPITAVPESATGALLAAGLGALLLRLRRRT